MNKTSITITGLDQVSDRRYDVHYIDASGQRCVFFNAELDLSASMIYHDETIEMQLSMITKTDNGHITC
jgi:hypothetical protein